MRVLIVPDKFKGTLSARAAARAMEAGIRRSFPDATTDLRPLADGGEGTLNVLIEHLSGRVVHHEVEGPLRATAAAELGLLRDGRAVVEMASASGLSLVSPEARDAPAASSRGTGELIVKALESGATEILVGVGGSASTDGGTGAARAIGWKFLDAAGVELRPGGAALLDLARIDGDRVADRARAVPIRGLCDVAHPLVGSRGAARTFARQKGATDEDVETLERALLTLAERVRADLGVDVDSVRGAGAGGGMGAGLIAFFNGELTSGAAWVASAAGVPSALHSADLVVTGEGTLDLQSLGEDGSWAKAPGQVAALARRAGVPCVAVCGKVELEPPQLRRAGFAAVVSVAETMGMDRAFSDPAGAVTEATERVARLWP